MKTIEEIEKYAKENYVPIARVDFVKFLKDLITQNNYHEVLEIGSAIGYTSINIGLMDNVYVTTIEHDENRFKILETNIKDFKLENKINYILADALDIFISLKFDVIFIDAAKAKNIAFFEKYKDNLKDNGVIIIDNMNLIDFSAHCSPKKKVFYDGKIKELKEYLNALNEYEVKYLDIGDGIAFIKKK